MAKKKPKKADESKSKTGLTVKQLQELANGLRGTSNHVYNLAERMFGKRYGDELFEDLLTFAKLFKCSECNEWLDLSEKEPSMFDICQTCVEEIDGHHANARGEE